MKPFHNDEEYGFWIDWPVLFLWVIGILVVLGGSFSFMADQGWLDRWLVQRVGTDYVGMLTEADGQTWQCKEVSYEGYCTEWDALHDTAVDVANAFGPGYWGVAKGEAPLLPADLWYAPILNPLNTMVFSFSMKTNIPVFAVLMIAVLASGTIIVVLVKPNNWQVVLALYALPGYVAFNSLAVLAGGPSGVLGMHFCGGGLVFIGLLLKFASSVSVSSRTYQNVDGERMSEFNWGPASKGGGGLKKGK